MATVVHPVAETMSRTAAVSGVLASFRMEGLEPDTATAALLAQYEAGSLSLNEFGLAIERYVAGMTSEKLVKGAA
jgi:hypothetical protein